MNRGQISYTTFPIRNLLSKITIDAFAQWVLSSKKITHVHLFSSWGGWNV